MVEKNQYNVKKLLKFCSCIDDILGGEGIVDYVAVTPNEFSLYIQKGVSMICVNEIEKLKSVFNPDAVFFNENNPQLIVSNTSLTDTHIEDTDINYFIDFVNACAEFICPCTGSEIHVKQNEIKVFIDQQDLLHSEYIGVYDLLDKTDLIFKISFNRQRPYLSIMCGGD